MAQRVLFNQAKMTQKTWSFEMRELEKVWSIEMLFFVWGLKSERY